MSDTSTQTPVITPDMQAMGIGGSPPQGEPPATHLTSEQRNDAMYAELAGMMEENADIGAIESQSQFTADGIRPAPANPVTQVDQTQVHQPAPSTIPQQSNTEENQDDLPFSLDGYTDPPVSDPSLAEGGGGTVSSEQNTSTPTAVDLNKIAEHVYGAVPDENTARQILQMAKEMQNVDPIKAAQIQAILNGTGYAPPVYQPQYQGPQQYQQQPTYQQPVQQPVQQQPFSQFQIPDDLDPDLAASLAPVAAIVQQQQQQIDQLNQRLYQDAQQRMQAEQQQMITAATNARSEWREAHKDIVTPTEWVIMEQQSVDSGLLGFYHQQTGDAAEAMRRTMEHLYATNPDIQERVLQQRVKEERARAAQQQVKTATSTALSGGGGAQTMATNQRVASNNPARNQAPLDPRRSLIAAPDNGMLSAINEMLTGLEGV